MPRKPHAGPTLRQRVLGRRLQGYRLAVGLTASAAAAHISRSTAVITRMENAEAALDPIKVKELLRLYGLNEPAVAEFLALIREANQPGWWQSYHDVLDVLHPGLAAHVSLETEAVQIRSFEPTVVPGLLQTPRYCEALLRLGFPAASDEAVLRAVQFRMRRQELLAKPDAPLFWTVIDEQVLARPAPESEVMSEQIEHLIARSRQPNISLQIIPFEVGLYNGAFGPFSVFRFKGQEFPDVVALERLECTEYHEQVDTVALYRATFENLTNTALGIDETSRYLTEVVNRRK